MKLVTRDADIYYLRQLKQVIEENGIPAYISGEDTARVIPPFAMTQAGLWVYLDEQHHDAEQLVLNPSHVVDNKIDVEAFYAQQPTKEEQQHHLNNALGEILLIVVFLILGMFFITFMLSK